MDPSHFGAGLLVVLFGFSFATVGCGGSSEGMSEDATSSSVGEVATTGTMGFDEITGGADATTTDEGMSEDATSSSAGEVSTPGTAGFDESTESPGATTIDEGKLSEGSSSGEDDQAQTERAEELLEALDLDMEPPEVDVDVPPCSGSLAPRLLGESGSARGGEVIVIELGCVPRDALVSVIAAGDRLLAPTVLPSSVAVMVPADVTGTLTLEIAVGDAVGSLDLEVTAVGAVADPRAVIEQAIRRAAAIPLSDELGDKGSEALSLVLDELDAMSPSQLDALARALVANGAVETDGAIEVRAVARPGAGDLPIGELAPGVDETSCNQETLEEQFECLLVEVPSAAIANRKAVAKVVASCAIAAAVPNLVSATLCVYFVGDLLLKTSEVIALNEEVLSATIQVVDAMYAPLPPTGSGQPLRIAATGSFTSLAGAVVEASHHRLQSLRTGAHDLYLGLRRAFALAKQPFTGRSPSDSPIVTSHDINLAFVSTELVSADEGVQFGGAQADGETIVVLFENPSQEELTATLRFTYHYFGLQEMYRDLAVAVPASVCAVSPDELAVTHHYSDCGACAPALISQVPGTWTLSLYTGDPSCVAELGYDPASYVPGDLLSTRDYWLFHADGTATYFAADYFYYNLDGTLSQEQPPLHETYNEHGRWQAESQGQDCVLTWWSDRYPDVLWNHVLSAPVRPWRSPPVWGPCIPYYYITERTAD